MNPIDRPRLVSVIECDFLSKWGLVEKTDYYGAASRQRLSTAPVWAVWVARALLTICQFVDSAQVEQAMQNVIRYPRLRAAVVALMESDRAASVVGGESDVLAMMLGWEDDDGTSGR